MCPGLTMGCVDILWRRDEALFLSLPLTMGSFHSCFLPQSQISGLADSYAEGLAEAPLRLSVFLVG